jgi:hypothetical protein
LIISFNQPAFIPWGGFFARLLVSDRMVLLDDTLLARGFTFVNRNRLKGPQGEIWTTVPLKRKGLGRQKIRELEVYEKERWQKKFLSTVAHYYGHSLYFKSVYEEIHRTVTQPGSRFLDLALGLLDVLTAGLGIGHEMILQSSTGVAGTGTSLLVSAARFVQADEVILPYGSEKSVDRALFNKARIKVRFLRYSPPQHPQFWGEFLPHLSALDLLLCYGREGRTIIEKGARLTESG